MTCAILKLATLLCCAGPAYGSVYQPVHLGSGGGNGSGVGGRGGGKMYWRNGKGLILDGVITLMGERGRGGNAGGGSGGSLLLETLNLTGFGLVDVGGGQGAGAGGGGGGGRIAVHIRFANKFAGRFRSVGGAGGGGTPGGAAGSIYVEETNRGPQYADIKYDAERNRTYVVASHRRLELDNENGDAATYRQHARPHLFTQISEDTDSYAFDELVLTRHANARIGYPDARRHVTVRIERFHGDRTGLVHVRSGQRLYSEYSEATGRQTRPPCSFLLDAGGELWMPEAVDVLGTRTVLGGRLVGVANLRIGSGANVVFLSSAQTAAVENGSFVRITTPGNFTFASLSVLRNSLAEFSEIAAELSVTAARVVIKHQGELRINRAAVYSGSAIVESGGVLQLDGRGGGAQRGAGAGDTLPDGTGTGGGHGGWGGSPGGRGGTPYDSVFAPVLSGSGGGRKRTALTLQA